MPSVELLSGDLLPELENRFWRLLRDALEQVLMVDGDLASHYRAELESASSYEILLAPHDNPIDVAATLAGISLTEGHLARYDEMVAQLAYLGRTEHSRPPEPMRSELPQPIFHKISQMCVGVSLVGDGNEVAHIDLIIGPRGSPAETAFVNALVNNKDGFTSLLAVIAPNLLVKPAMRRKRRRCSVPLNMVSPRLSPTVSRLALFR